MKYLKSVFIFSLASLVLVNWVKAEEAPVKEIQVIGEFFGQPVPAQNYFFIKSVILAFGNRWNLTPQSEEELDSYVWDYLLLSYEAFRNKIVAGAEEINAEIEQILKENNAGFDRDKDKAAYVKWVKEKTNQTPEVFENQVRFILEIERLRQKIISNLAVTANDEEAHRQFLDEHNRLSIEIAGFLKKEDATSFYEKVKANPKSWEEQENEYPDSFKRYELVTLNLLISELGVERDTLYKMLDFENGGIYMPLSITQGYGVFKILNKKLAQEAEYAKLKYRYLDQIKEKKINQGFQDWLSIMRQKAKIKIYRRGG